MDRNDEAWRNGREIPPIEARREMEFIVAVRRAHSGHTFSFAATYLNAFPLQYNYGCPRETAGCDGNACNDGCPTTGWFILTGDDDDARQYQALELREGDELLGWRNVPQWPHPNQQNGG